MNTDFEQLRHVFESNDPFMGGGHQIVGLRRRKRVIPSWTQDNRQVKKVLLQSFPKLETNSWQRNRAARWARIIHLYFRLQYTNRQTADELGMKVANLKRMIISIKRSAAGKLTSVPLSRTQGGRREDGLQLSRKSNAVKGL